MGRLDRLLKYVDLSGQGIEIAPYFNPAVPKRAGHDVVILDVFDTETLRANALGDPGIPDTQINDIEQVDFVGDASKIGALVTEQGREGSFDYVVSSHSFEHLPNPILFLQGVEVALKPGGILSMAIPDCRATFDHFRMPTRLSDWLAAYHGNASQPSPEILFDQFAHKAMYLQGGMTRTGCNPKRGRPERFEPRRTVPEAYQDYLDRKAHDAPYKDAHCNVVFPETLELMLRDLAQLGLISLQVREITQSEGFEFFVHLEKQTAPTPIPEDQFYTRRAELLRQISRKLGVAIYHRRPGISLSRRALNGLDDLRMGLKQLSRKLRGKA